MPQSCPGCGWSWQSKYCTECKCTRLFRYHQDGMRCPVCGLLYPWRGSPRSVPEVRRGKREERQ